MLHVYTDGRKSNKGKWQFLYIFEEQQGTVVNVFLTLVQRSPIQIMVEPKTLIPSLLTPLLHLICGAGAMDDIDLKQCYSN